MARDFGPMTDDELLDHIEKYTRRVWKNEGGPGYHTEHALCDLSASILDLVGIIRRMRKTPGAEG